MIHIWTAVLVFIDAPVNQYLLATHRQSQLVVKSVVVLLVNFCLAFFLVPRFGPQGAAAATLIAQATAVLALPALYPPLRDLRSIYRQAITETPGLVLSILKLIAQRLNARSKSE
jgi:O-antigen/teichoic acid export membrane protein